MATYSFWDLHVAIQDAMGWLDYHLHEFRLLDADEQHVLAHEGMDSAEASRAYPRCVSGARRCPPEDCGWARRSESDPFAARKVIHLKA